MQIKGHKHYHAREGGGQTFYVGYAYGNDDINSLDEQDVTLA